ncbi:MAG: LacI family DNA-binding transcriptional regulator [Bacilli bacterium]|nr:LacI family DNA-binding transcriptional regulator [Bacilli bacterium]
MSKKVTIYDIAKYLNVTPATVSYALNNVSKVSEETRKKILETAKELGYSRDYNAVSLSTGKTHLMALFLPFEDISKPFLENPFYGEFIGGFEKQIMKQDYDLLVQPALQEKDMLPWLRKRGVDAIAVIGTYPKYFIKAFKTYNKPVVLVDSYGEKDNEFNTVLTADTDGVFESTSYLINNGHKRIAFVSGYKESSLLDMRRFQGYVSALKEHDIPLDESIIFERGISIEEGLKLTDELIKKDITGIICAADTLAIGIINGLKLKGKRIPDDYSVIGFDDIQSAKYISPSLTTIRQDITEKGRLAAKLLLDDLRNNENNHKQISLAPELIIRDSVKKIS